jgi:hypothetical protein
VNSAQSQEATPIAETEVSNGGILNSSAGYNIDVRPPSSLGLLHLEDGIRLAATMQFEAEAMAQELKQEQAGPLEETITRDIKVYDKTLTNLE